MYRKQVIPASCAALKLETVADELIKRGGNITQTAKHLGVPITDLRLMTLAHPRLIDAALEAEEQALDEAEAVLREALVSEDQALRLSAAIALLKASPAAARRGFRNVLKRPGKED